jgi:hypothetical protein
VFPDSLPAQLTEILTLVGIDAAGNPCPFIDQDWKLEACRFVNGDPTGLEIVFTGVLGGRLRLTASAKKLGKRFFTYAFADDPGNPAYTPIANGLSSLVKETIEPKQPDVTLDMDLITMGRSRI